MRLIRNTAMAKTLHMAESCIMGIHACCVGNTTYESGSWGVVREVWKEQKGLAVLEMADVPWTQTTKRQPWGKRHETRKLHKTNHSHRQLRRVRPDTRYAQPS